MRRVAAGLGSLAIAAGLTTTFALSAGAAAPPDGTTVSRGRTSTDELPNPAEEKRRELREVALQQGAERATRRSRSAAAARWSRSARRRPTAAAPAEDQYVELAREKTDKIFVVLAEFGNERAPGLSGPGHGRRTCPGRRTWNGPLHNEMPAPDRTKDNSTIWQPDYNRAHYEQMYFGDRRGRRVGQDLLRAPVVRPLQRRRARSPTGSRSATTRPATGAATATRARTTCARTRGT